jgi:hypothetical protein
METSIYRKMEHAKNGLYPVADDDLTIPPKNYKTKRKNLLRKTFNTQNITSPNTRKILTDYLR